MKLSLSRKEFTFAIYPFGLWHFILKNRMFQTIVRQATTAYRPLPTHHPGEPGVKYTGKMVHETQLSCFYITPGGKDP